MNINKNYLIYFLILLSVFSIIGNVILYREHVKLVEVSELMRMGSLLSQHQQLAMQAGEYYDNAMVNYDLGEWNDLISNCKLSRTKSSEYVQKVRESKATITRTNELADLYKSLLEKSILIYNNLYESCEYLESSARCYNVNDYSCGGTNIDLSNEKIRAHDIAVSDYNEILAKISYEVGDYI